MTLDYLIISLIVVATPGTGAVYTIAAGLGRGSRASVIAAFGCTLGIVPHMLAAITGLAALLHASALAFEIVKYAGVAYLLYMAWATWRERGAMNFSGQTNAAPRSGWQITLEAVLVNILNPKLSIFFLAFLPQFIAASDPAPLGSMLILSAAFMAMTFAVFAVYGLFAAAMRDHVLTRPKVMLWLRRTFAAAFVGLGVKLAMAER
ncbi:LysE family translocator [Ferrovibrio sp.]|uniref:LysE family translocator n=1 Tax=Ferrovibrio sp. TaxID=1917215 RepID=UPI003D0CF114